SFQENLSNLERDRKLVTREFTTDNDIEDLSELTANLKKTVENIREDLEEVRDMITNQEFLDFINNELEKSDAVIERAMESINAADKKEDVQNDTKKEKKDKEEKDIIDKVLTKEEEDQKL